MNFSENNVTLTDQGCEVGFGRQSSSQSMKIFKYITGQNDLHNEMECDGDYLL